MARDFLGRGLLLLLLSAWMAAATTISTCADLTRITKATVIAAHQDDIETIAGGTVAIFVSCGIQVSYIITTNGDKGWNKGFNMTSSLLATIRENEQIKAGEVIGVTNITFLQQEDGRLEGVDPIALKKNLTKWVRVYQPDLILTFSPEIDYPGYHYGVMHTDHQVTGKSAMATVWPSVRDYLSFVDLYDEGYLPWIVPEVWLFSFSPAIQRNSGNIISIEICGSVFEKKLNSLLEHRSQYDDAAEVEDSLKTLGEYVHRSNYDSNSNGNCKLAEAFQQIHIL